MKDDATIKILAYYLPQFHAIPENDLWWGKGFTEWTTLNDNPDEFSPQEIRRPIEPHFQYELPSKSVMEWQQVTAQHHGIDGFIVWDYWFGNSKRLLEKTMRFVLEEEIDFKYCFMWANHSWYNKTLHKLLMKQEYLGEKDYELYFQDILPHILTGNYVFLDNRPVFGIFLPLEIPDLALFIATFNRMAASNNIPNFYFIAENLPFEHEASQYFDKIVNTSQFFSMTKRASYLGGVVNVIKERLIRKYNLNFLGPVFYSYRTLVSDAPLRSVNSSKFAPTIFTGWNTTPRHRRRGTVLYDFDIDSFKKHVNGVFEFVRSKKSSKNIQLLIVKSWNEWAEGNVIEPDSRFGYDLLEILKMEVLKGRND